jgi:acetyltransferase
VSDLVSEIPQIIELDINPLIVDAEGVIAADARIVIDYAPSTVDRYAHMAIHPYPNHLVEEWILPDGASVTIRPVRPEDAEIERAFFDNLSDESRYFRFMDTIRELSKPQLVRFTQIDYDRDMAFVAVQIDDEGNPVQIGVSRYVANPDGETVEFALTVADSWQKRGLGRKLMQVLIDCARGKGFTAVVGEVLSDNSKMLNLMSSLGFKILPNPEDNSVKRVVKPLTH